MSIVEATRPRGGGFEHKKNAEGMCRARQGKTFGAAREKPLSTAKSHPVAPAKPALSRKAGFLLEQPWLVILWCSLIPQQLLVHRTSVAVTSQHQH